MEARAARWRSGLFWLVVLLCTGAVSWTGQAQAPEVLVGPTGLSGGRHVGSAWPAPNAVRMSASLGYGFTEPVLGMDDRHHRVALDLAGAWVARPWFQIAIAGEARLDRHTPDDLSGWLGSSLIATRHAFKVADSTALAFSPRVLFPGAEDASHGFRAASFELSALLSQRLAHEIELSLSVGYRLDRTKNAISNVDQLAPSQQLSAALSDRNAYLLGALGSVPIGTFQLGAEWSWDIRAGGSPNAVHAPMRLALIAQRQIGERFLPRVELGVDTSARPTFETYVRIEPRLWLRFSLSIRLDRAGKARVRVPRYTAPAEARVSQSAPPPRKVAFDVTDAQGEPIAGARVNVGGRVYESDDTGRIELELPAGTEAVTVEAPGYEPTSQPIGADAEPRQRVSLTAPAPGSEIKGVVRNMASQPLAAKVEVLPLGTRVNTDREGQFVIRIAPGDYTLRISAEGYESQERPAQVEPSGVTIIVVDMKRARK